MTKPNRFAVLTFFIVSLSFLSACQSIAYYSQSIVGHTKLMMARSPVDVAVLDAEPGIAHKLLLSRSIKDFAVKELALSPNNSYSSYVFLEREFPVWIVVAAQKYSLDAKQWCYLVIGCASYRGYFSQQAAEKYANQLERQGWETYVGGASAYSTLGWFADPLLPSMMRGSDAAFAELLFHEIAHQRLYVNGQTGFNEAFASFVGQEGVKRWLQVNHPDDIPTYTDNIMAEHDFSAMVGVLKGRLHKVYQSSASELEKGHQKQQLIRAFKTQYEALKAERWGGHGYYDRWLLTPINNAKLAAFSAYHDLMPQLSTLFRACGANFERFYSRLENNPNLDYVDDCH